MAPTRGFARRRYTRWASSSKPIFDQTNAEYRAGVVHGRNEGLENHFRSNAFLEPDFTSDATTFLETVKEIDGKHPAPHSSVSIRPGIDTVSPVNFFKEALKISRWQHLQGCLPHWISRS